MTETLANGYSSEFSARAFKWIPTRQGLDGSQISFYPACDLD